MYYILFFHPEAQPSWVPVHRRWFSYKRNGLHLTASLGCCSCRLPGPCRVRWASVSVLFPKEWLPQTVSDTHEGSKAPEAGVQQDSREVACDSCRKWEMRSTLLPLDWKNARAGLCLKYLMQIKMTVLNPWFSPVRLWVRDFVSEALRRC